MRDEKRPSIQRVVFFDGHCGLCNRFVDWGLRHDPEGRVRWAPLQGTTAQSLLPPADREDLRTVIFWDDGQILKKSEAVLRLLEVIGQKNGAQIGRWFPLLFRDRVYDFVARHRFDLFARSETCRMPTPEERERFLP